MITYTYNALYLCSIYIFFCSTNSTFHPYLLYLQIFELFWAIIAQMFCMLQPTIQHLVKKVFVIVDEPKYTRNISVYCVTMFV